MDLDRLKDERGSGQVTFKELLPISEKLRFRKQTITELEAEKQELQGQMEQAEADARQLAQRRMDELAPEEYQLFLAAYRKLGLDQRAVIDAMADGVSVQTLSNQLGKKKSTIYSYRRDIYEKVGIQGSDKLRRLRLLVALMRREQEEQPH